jgi:glycerol uptake facilitator-like aquaporin
MFQFPLPAYQAEHGGGRPPRVAVVPLPMPTPAHVYWRSLLDNCMVEAIATLFISLTTILCWPEVSDTGPLQFMPPLALGLVLLCLKDEDYFFPDGAPTVTLVLWVLGGYAWPHMLARLCGQAIGTGLALAIALGAEVPKLDHRVEHARAAVFALELVGTMVEHLAVVFMLMPLLPPTSPSEQGKVRPKAHQDTPPPPNSAVMHAAISFSVLHWCLWRGLCVEMSPPLTLMVAILRGSRAHWDVVSMALWGQAVGLGACMAYAALFIPRETKYWPARFTNGARAN